MMRYPPSGRFPRLVDMSRTPALGPARGGGGGPGAEPPSTQFTMPAEVGVGTIGACLGLGFGIAGICTVFIIVAGALGDVRRAEEQQRELSRLKAFRTSCVEHGGTLSETFGVYGGDTWACHGLKK